MVGVPGEDGGPVIAGQAKVPAEEVDGVERERAGEGEHEETAEAGDEVVLGGEEAIYLTLPQDERHVRQRHAAAGQREHGMVSAEELEQRVR